MENKFVRVGVGIIVKKDDKVLMQKRKGAHGEETWCFPGGHLEFNEKIEECAVREVMEEVGIKIKNIKIGPITNDIFTKEDKHYITIFVTSDIAEGEPEIKEKDRIEEIKWVGFDNMPKPLFVPVQNLINGGFRP